MKNKNSFGFTIIELIVVIAIISVLAAVVISATVIYINRAKDAAVKANVSQIAKKLQIWYGEKSGFSTITKTDIISQDLQDEGYDFAADTTGATNQYIAWGKMTGESKYFAQNYSGASGILTGAPQPATNGNGYELVAGDGSGCGTDDECDNCTCSSETHQCVPCGSGETCNTSHACVVDMTALCNSKGSNDPSWDIISEEPLVYNTGAASYKCGYEGRTEYCCGSTAGCGWASNNQCMPQ